MVLLKKLNSKPFLLAAFALSCMTLLYFFLFPLYGQYFPKCIFYNATGLYCPGCGSQRAISALLHLDIADAAHDNLLAIVSIPFLVYAFALYVTGDDAPKRCSLFYSPLFVKFVLAVVICFCIARNIPAYPFTLLAPLN